MAGIPQLVLASGSPRRLRLLAQIGVVPTRVAPVEIDETPRRGELPRQLATRLAAEKASVAAVSDRSPAGTRTYTLAADTVVAVGRRILPKAEDEETAAACLALLSGRAHRVFTGVCLIAPGGAVRRRLVESRVQFKRLSAGEERAYLGSGEWRGKAGGYAIQGFASAFVARIAGSYSNVVGLPLYETAALLAGEGLPVHLNWRSD